MYNYQEANHYKRKAKKTNKISFIKIVIITIIFIVSFSLLTVISSFGSKPVSYTEILIKKGDTIWSIAQKYNYNQQDPRKLVRQIKIINNIQNSILQPGQMIKIPG